MSIANSRGPHTLPALAEETGATPVTAAEAAEGARVVVVTIPVKAVPNLPADAFATWPNAATGWTVLPGTYGIHVGTSSTDLPLRTQGPIT